MFKVKDVFVMDKEVKEDVKAPKSELCIQVDGGSGVHLYEKYKRPHMFLRKMVPSILKDTLELEDQKFNWSKDACAGAGGFILTEDTGKVYNVKIEILNVYDPCKKCEHGPDKEKCGMDCPVKSCSCK